MSGRGVMLAPVVIGMSMLAAAAGAAWLTPRDSGIAVPRLAQIVPTAFGDWKEVITDVAPVDPTVNRIGPRDTDSPYDDVLMRAYENSHGDVVLLALAYGRHQRQEIKIHRPELCYVAQGFDVTRHVPTTIRLANGSHREVSGMRILAQAAERIEVVSYWLRIGDLLTQNAWSTRLYIFKEGIKGKVHDGILVRVSQVVRDLANVSERQYHLQELFIVDLIEAIPVDQRHLLVGS